MAESSQRPIKPRKTKTKTPARAPRGRPTAYRAEYAEQAGRLALLGQTDAEMAAFFEVSEATFHRWKHAHRDFCESIKRGKVGADVRVAESLYRRALGYSHPDVHVSNYQGEVTLTNIVKHYPPDTTAGIFWLKNRQPDKWRDRIEHQADIAVSMASPAELQNLFVGRMAEARERQRKVLLERGLVDPDTLQDSEQ